MYFLGVLHAIVQMPKDLYTMGISDCHHSIQAPWGINDANKLSIKMDKLDKIDGVFTRRVTSAFPDISESDLNYFKNAIAEVSQKSYWNEPKTRIICVNGYTIRNGQSVNFNLVFTNENVQGEYILYDLKVNKMPYKFSKTFAYTTTFDLANGQIQNPTSSVPATKISMAEIECVAQSIAPFYFGTVLMNIDFFQASIDHIKALISKYVTIMTYIDAEEATAALTEVKSRGFVDFTSIAERVRKICLITPTPSPMPTPQPTISGKQPAKNHHVRREKRRFGHRQGR